MQRISFFCSHTHSHIFAQIFMMKKLFISILFFVAIINWSCLKSEKGCTAKSVASEEAAINAFITTSGMTATRHSSGVYYQVMSPGSGSTPSISSRVYITYTGQLLNGTIFDQQANSNNTGWILSELINGWQIGLPLIQEGGRIKLVVPSSLGYGCNAVGPIPANSILYFDITLVDVQ
jgi:FKBP-type peptidyl-prolyl cis-trans isomerase FkpA